MTTPPKILAFAGSAREASFNKMLVKIAAEGAKMAGAEVTYLDLRELPMPLFDQDLEAKEGLTENVLKFKTLLKEHHAFAIASPEYNSSITPLLKNVIDWASRPEPGEAPMALTCFRGKIAALMATSPGGLGGLRGLSHIRSILSSIGVLVIPEQKAIPNAFQAFSEEGKLKDEKQQTAIAEIGRQLAITSAKLLQD
ncbi:NADPH-dependent FMN reductase [Oscillatoria salina]|uniref:NADPH-dependent FMN reductase n=1 Tax=Oscillatoria salina TaxID=331517 RepID=UPI0013B5BC8B|nr:NAD(P)H-dependent oxidoreductase [Oscillatoria salina]MBZ8178976.1 NAD(P)H-dependent oxidoreductase [Oscillatoria salina IIICB1]NET88175.1 NAD(P)H-dependent oxidoreductase [Kamptonema sp. SIO1D9]